MTFTSLTEILMNTVNERLYNVVCKLLNGFLLVVHLISIHVSIMDIVESESVAGQTKQNDNFDTVLVVNFWILLM